MLRRRGLGRLAALAPRSPVIRYERERPGELIHIDIKKLDRIGRQNLSIYRGASDPARYRATELEWPMEIGGQT